MARPRNPKRDEAFQIWKDSNGEKKLKDIAIELNLSDSQIRKWKNQDKWEQQLNGNVTKSKGNVTKRTRGAPKGNKNAIGNDGGAPKRNQNAVTHGLFSKYIPQETLELMGMLEEKSAADLIWDQIMIQYAAIIRAQQIMHVESKEEMIKELKKAKYEYHEIPDGDSVKLEKNTIEEEYEFQFAWDRQATFLTAQSRAMSELRNLIKQFNDLAHDDDERKLKLQLMQANIKKAEVEAERLSKENTDDESEEIIVVDAWSDSNE